MSTLELIGVCVGGFVALEFLIVAVLWWRGDRERSEDREWAWPR